MKRACAVAAVLGGLLLLGGLVHGDEPDRLIMPHDLHFEMEVDCASCHDGIESSTAAGDLHRPDMDVCADCHDVDDDEGCVMCHTNPDEAESLVPPTPRAERFSHAAHVDGGLACAACHGPATLASPVMPGKPDCRSCHETAEEFGDCALCHGPDESLVPASHELAWLSEHGLAARRDQADCALCHTETGCQECHAGDNVRPRSHELNFAFSHAIQARGNEAMCATCHQEPQFCVTCHQAERVLPRSHSQVGWVRSSDGGQHAVDGLFEMEDCIACHDAGEQSPTCARCHGG
jgi:hypothetical protein